MTDKKKPLKKLISNVNLVVKEVVSNDNNKLKPVAIKLKPKPENISKDFSKIQKTPVIETLSLKELEDSSEEESEESKDLSEEEQEKRKKRDEERKRLKKENAKKKKAEARQKPKEVEPKSITKTKATPKDESPVELEKIRLENSRVEALKSVLDILRQDFKDGVLSKRQYLQRQQQILDKFEKGGQL